MSNKVTTKIRNFCIIAHIDHGKSTLADRFLELTGALSARDMTREQMLDTMEIEQERGITIKLQPVRMQWKSTELNLIDTPGHVDFAYEVSRSLAACEGAVLVVDATQGVEAQTLANTYLALAQGLHIIPVLNKTDLPAAEPERRAEEIENLLGFKAEDILTISAKTGENISKLLDKIIADIPPPSENSVYSSREIFASKDTKALIFDSSFDPYRGVVSSIRVFAGEINKGDRLALLKTKTNLEALEVGYLCPSYVPTKSLKIGEVGYIVTGLKNVSEAKVGDTIWKKSAKNLSDKSSPPLPLPGYSEPVPFVFAGIYPISGEDFPLLRKGIEKLVLNDASLVYSPETSSALGNGFRVGFLGLLHLDIVRERLEREFNLHILVTSPSVNYEIVQSSGDILHILNPSELPEAGNYTEIREPWVKVNLFCPKKYIGGIMKLCTDRRGISRDLQYPDPKRAEIHFELPLAEIVTDFYDRLKSISSGYGSMSYEPLDMRKGDLAKLDILVAGDKVDALSQIIYKPRAHSVGSLWCKKLKEIIPRAQFVIAIQAALGGTVVARETLSARRKDVTAKLYGGDVTRKNKLLKKQKKGKKRLKKFGSVSIPQEAFFAMMKQD